MRVTVNGEEREIEDGATVARLLDHLRPAAGPAAKADACAVEINRMLVPRRFHAERHLAEGDRVEIVTLVGGG